MKPISRHLRPIERKPMPLFGWLVLSSIGTIVICCAITHLFTFAVSALIAALLLWAHDLGEKQRLKALLKHRKGDICTFRKSFDVRRVDPWIIRASYEELSGYLSSQKGPFPLRADDRLDEDLEIDPEDLEDIASDIAERAGYSMAGIEQNPLYGHVFTVRDLVLFFTYQTKLQNNVQGPAVSI